MSKNTDPGIQADQDLIERLGGTTNLARLLGWPLPGGARRVNNWRARGIPARIKLEYPNLFLKGRHAKASNTSRGL